jgi:hypothetical protein
LGCPGDWQPECAATELVFSADDEIWQSVFNAPAGSWEYKAALNDSWDENYGAGAVANGSNISLDLSGATDVKFYYDHYTHWVTDNVNSRIVTAAGSFQSELGCSGDWQPDCLQSWLQDLDGDGIYEFVTASLGVGTFEVKAAIAESWDENYGAGGIQNGNNIQFNVPTIGSTVEFSFESATNLLSISIAEPDDGTVNVPAPATIALVVLGLFGASCARRRRAH